MRPAAVTLLFIVPVIAAADGNLQVRARYPRGPRGTMHFAEAITVSAPSVRPLTLKGSFLPIPGPSFELPGSRYVLLGWSSTGAGMQSIHVYLLGVQGAASTGSRRSSIRPTALTRGFSSGTPGTAPFGLACRNRPPGLCMTRASGL